MDAADDPLAELLDEAPLDNALAAVSDEHSIASARFVSIAAANIKR